jgi:hypothetical protein
MVATSICRRRAHGSLPRHSPSPRAQSKGCGEVLLLGGRRGERIGYSVVGRAVNWTAQAPFDVQAGPVLWHVSVPCPRVVVIIARERDGCLIVGKGDEMGLKVPEDG